MSKVNFNSLKEAGVYVVEQTATYPVTCDSSFGLITNPVERGPMFAPEIPECTQVRYKEFIGLDDKIHTYEYSKEDYLYHSYMTNEQWLEKNDSVQLEYCKKCTMWKLCRNHEHSLLTMDGIVDKNVDELTKEINQRILERIK